MCTFNLYFQRDLVISSNLVVMQCVVTKQTGMCTFNLYFQTSNKT